MRFMVIVKADKRSESESNPAAGDEQLLAEMGKFNQELVKAGVMLAGEGLHPSRRGRGSASPAGRAPSPTALSPRPRSWWPVSGSGR